MQGQLLGKDFDIPRTPHGATWELPLPVFVRDYEYKLAQRETASASNRPVTPTSKTQHGKPKSLVPGQVVTLEDVQKQHSRLLLALGDHLEELGRTISIYAAVERDSRDAVKFVQPGTLGGLQGAISSLIRKSGNDFFGWPPTASDADGHVQSEAAHMQLSAESCIQPRSPTRNHEQAHGQRETSVKLDLQLERPINGERETSVCFNLQNEKPVTAIRSVEFACDSEANAISNSHQMCDVSANPDYYSSKPKEQAPRQTMVNEESRWKKWRQTMVHEDVTRQQLGPFNRSDSAESEIEKSTGFSGNLKRRFLDTGPKTGETVVSGVIVVYSFVLGVQVDIEWDGWQILEYFFTMFFLGEFLTKLWLSGVKGYFTGPEWGWNIFDFFVVMITIADSCLSLFHKADVDLTIFTTVKVVRLGRLARLVRLLRFAVFKELKAMIMGVVSGFRVLLWAVFLFFSFIYVLAIVIRQNIGPEFKDEDANPQLKKAFKSMGASMNTLFMCFTDACDAFDGTPLQVHFFDEHGALVVTLYMFTILFVTIGLFNLIMAIFVDNVLERGRQQKLEKRALDRVRLEKRLRTVVTMIYNKAQPPRSQSRWFNISFLEKWCNKLFKLWEWVIHQTSEIEAEEDLDIPLCVTREEFADLLQQPAMNRVLRHMEIETSSHYDLFDILDADMSGELEYDELIVGLMSLRGPVEKKDIIGSLLCIRATQQLLRDVQDATLLEMQKMSAESEANMEKVLAQLTALRSGPAQT